MEQESKPVVNNKTTMNNLESQLNDVLTFTEKMHEIGRVDKEQVDIMKKFVNGEVDYGTMRSMCG